MQCVQIPDKAIPETDSETLIFCFDRWVAKVANRYKNAIERTGAIIDIDDLIQVGRLALLRAQNKYDPAGGAGFLTFSFDYLRGAMRRELEKNMRKLPLNAFVSLDERIKNDGPETYAEIIEDKTIESADERLERLDAAAEVRAAVDRLKQERQKEIIKKVYFEDKELKKVAAEMGLKEGYTYALHSDALSRLRKDKPLVLLCAPHFSVSVSGFLSRWGSAVEAEVIWRDEHLYNNCEVKYDPPDKPARHWSDKQTISYMKRMIAKRNKEQNTNNEKG